MIFHCPNPEQEWINDMEQAYKDDCRIAAQILGTMMMSHAIMDADFIVNEISKLGWKVYPSLGGDPFYTIEGYSFTGLFRWYTSEEIAEITNSAYFMEANPPGKLLLGWKFALGIGLCLGMGPSLNLNTPPGTLYETVYKFVQARSQRNVETDLIEDR